MALVLKSMVPTDLRKVYNPQTEEISKVVLIAIQGAPQEITDDVNLKQNVTVHDAVAMVVFLSNEDHIEAKYVYIIAENVMVIKNHEGTLISFNGLMNTYDKDYFLEAYENSSDFKAMTEESVDRFLETNKSESVAKVFSEINEYFTAEKYQLNNNVFRLVSHRNRSLDLAKTVLVRSLIAWQLKQ